MTAMTLIAVAGLAVGEPSFECDWSVISAADVAVVLLWRYGGCEECDLDDAAVVYRHGTDISALGGYRFLALLWR